MPVEPSVGGSRVARFDSRAPIARSTATVAGSVIDRLEAEHGPRLFGFARRAGLDTEQANDAVQEALTRLLLELDRGVAVEDPRGWAYRVIYRIAMDQHRFGRRLQGLRQRIASQWRHPSQQDLADRIAVWTEIDRLPPRQRQVLYLRYRSDLPFDDIADVVGITASAARSHATQAMATLRRRLLDEDGR